MNSELQRLALAKVGNPNILVNIISRRVRQLTSNGQNSRPLISETAGMGAADIALTELIEEKIGWTMLEKNAGSEDTSIRARKKRKKA